MTTNNTYKCLNNNFFSIGRYSLVPIRFEDRMLIMKWRNEQIYHLRQAKPLTENDQNNYFNNVVAHLFEQEQPEQILFSYLEDGKCIGYGGLVHINRTDRNAEISFIIDTRLEKESFKTHWGIYLDLLEQVAFDDLNLHKIYTYAFDLRPQLYEAIEDKGYVKDAVLKEHCLFGGEYIDVVIHSKTHNEIILRKATIQDKQLIFEWANDELTRANSFHSAPIDFETHSAWYDKKINDEKAIYFIGETGNKPVGLVRFDKDQHNNSIVIGVMLDKQYRGKGMASVFLRKACIEYQKLNKKDIFAFIKVNNTASVRSFSKAGFVFEKELSINGIKAFQYKWRKS